MRMSALPLAANRLRLTTGLLLSIAGSAWFAGSVEAQVFKDDQVCWSCLAPSVQGGPEQYVPVRRQKQPTSKVSENTGKRRPTKASAPGVVVKGSGNALPAAAAIRHKVAIQVNQNDKRIMDLALSNARNIVDYY